jgi:hypothetical protein
LPGRLRWLPAAATGCGENPFISIEMADLRAHPWLFYMPITTAILWGGEQINQMVCDMECKECTESTELLRPVAV